jgi:peptidoglycan/xylan/chitin deacetylase (PgdA/CDA1 family)
MMPFAGSIRRHHDLLNRRNTAVTAHERHDTAGNGGLLRLQRRPALVLTFDDGPGDSVGMLDSEPVRARTTWPGI